MRTLLFATALLAPSLLVAQTTPRDVARERAERTHWLSADPLSPARAIGLTAIPATGLTIGSDASDIPFGTPTSGTIKESAGQLMLSGWGTSQPLPRGRATATHGVHLLPFGAAGNTQLLVYRDAKPGKRPMYFSYSPSAKLAVTLTPTSPKSRRILAPNGSTADGTEIGTVAATFGGSTTALRVMRVALGQDESQLLINFRDGTTGNGTYPAGRYVELIPAGGDRYILDLNRAFNPNCAYSSVFPCPLPWNGNTIPARVEAGEKYPPEMVAK